MTFIQSDIHPSPYVADQGDLRGTLEYDFETKTVFCGPPGDRRSSVPAIRLAVDDIVVAILSCGTHGYGERKSDLEIETTVLFRACARRIIVYTARLRCVA